MTARASGPRLTLLSVRVFDTLAHLIEATTTCTQVCVDMPIGFSEDGSRRVDALARRMIGPRRSSVFPPPPRAVLEAEGDYATLNRLSRRLRAGMSKQCFNLLPRMREADTMLTPELQQRVRESHPEVSFRVLKGEYLDHPKRSAAGRVERLQLLSGVYGPAVEAWRPPRGAAMDDLYDAAVLAWTAARVAGGLGVTLPAEPEYDARELRMEVVY